jgi:hypothetical protein
MMKEACAK